MNKFCTAIRNVSGHFYLNGNWRIDFPRDLNFAGTDWIYERKPVAFYSPEVVRAVGPINEAVFIVVSSNHESYAIPQSTL